MKLTLVPAGEFTMGSPENEPGAYSDELPQHQVKIGKAFYLGVYCVKRDQFARFVTATKYKTEPETDGHGCWGYAANGSWEQSPKFNWRNTGWEQTGEHPVVNVSWNDAMEFCSG